MDGIELGGFLEEYEHFVNEIFEASINVWNGVWESAKYSAAFGGVISGLYTSTQISNHKNIG